MTASPERSVASPAADLRSRRELLKLGLGGLAGAALAGRLPAVAAEPPASAGTARPLLTPAAEFVDVARGDPVPHTLRGEALVAARLTPDDWRLEIVADDSARVSRPRQLSDGTAIDLPTLVELGKTKGVKLLKAVQCLNIPQPLGQGLWEGVPLREVLRLAGKLTNVRRVYYWGFHNDKPEQMFRSSLSYTQAMEAAPSEPPALVVWRLNGQPLSLLRGGPVRMVVPWAHGFKSIKWLQKTVLTNDYKANDTYAESGDNDPESHLKTAAYIDPAPAQFPAGKAVGLRGTAIVGLSGLVRVEHWLRPAPSQPGELREDDPAWNEAKWIECRLDDEPTDWAASLPRGVAPRELWGFDPATGRPKQWPLRYGMIGWSASIADLAPGKYELRVRTVDANGFAQPEPRPNPKAGRNAVQVHRFEVTG
jgi:DMSO/TMAO reductase YedYZ molybdopterin-dependent catalytic subunit